jgi:hypothetical protein
VRVKVIRIWEGENSETLVRIYYIDDVVDNIAWKYSVAPLPRLCKERKKEPTRLKIIQAGMR